MRPNAIAMEDELDDRILYQTYISHVKLMSRFAWGLPLNYPNVSPLAYVAYAWRLLRVYILKPEILIFGTIIVFTLMYLQAVDVWSRNLIGRLQSTLTRSSQTKINRLGVFTPDVEKNSWDFKSGPIACYAVQGYRPKMEDRFVINENVQNTGVTLLAVFDGHGGEFAANYAKDKLMTSLFSKVVQIKDLIRGHKVAANPEEKKADQVEKKVCFHCVSCFT